MGVAAVDLVCRVFFYFAGDQRTQVPRTRWLRPMPSLGTRRSRGLSWYEGVVLGAPFRAGLHSKNGYFSPVIQHRTPVRSICHSHFLPFVSPGHSSGLFASSQPQNKSQGVTASLTVGDVGPLDVWRCFGKVQHSTSSTRTHSQPGLSPSPPPPPFPPPSPLPSTNDAVITYPQR